METREVRLVFGDWSGDGHQLTKIIRLNLTGDDVSDEAMRTARLKAEEASGIVLESLLEEYEEYEIDEDDFFAILDAGMDIRQPENEDVIIGYSVDFMDKQRVAEAKLDPNASDYYFDAVRLVMAFLSFDMDNFSYSVVPEPDTILGNYGAVVNGFGYGLFSS